MKKLLLICSIIITIVTVVASATTVTYTKENCKVVQAYNNYNCAIDSEGEAWTWYGDGVEVGDYVTLIMDTKHTIRYKDDRVIGVEIND